MCGYKKSKIETHEEWKNDEGKTNQKLHWFEFIIIILSTKIYHLISFDNRLQCIQKNKRVTSRKKSDLKLEKHYRANVKWFNDVAGREIFN